MRKPKSESGHMMVTLPRLLRSVRLAREEGQVMPMFAAGLLAMLLMTGIVIDGGNLFQNRQSLQNAADASALAAALYIADNSQTCVAGAVDPIGSCAGNYALWNGANGPNGDSSDSSACTNTGTDPCALPLCNSGPGLSVSDTQAPTKAPGCYLLEGPQQAQVEVWLVRHTSNFFGALLGIQNSTESARAVASLTGGGSPPPFSFVTLQSDGENHTLLVSNVSQLNVDNSLYDDSCANTQPTCQNVGGGNAHDAFDINEGGGSGGALLDKKDEFVVGGWENKGGGAVGANGQTCPLTAAQQAAGVTPPATGTAGGEACPTVGMPYLPDPFALLPQPTPGTPAGGAAVTILKTSRASSIATVVTSPAGTFAAGDTVTILGVGSGFDGTYTVASASPSTNTFTYDNSQGSDGCAPGCPDLPVITNEQMAGGVATLTTNAPATTLSTGENDLGVFGLGSIFNIPGSDGTVTQTTSGTSSSTFSYQVPLSIRQFTVNQMGLQGGTATLNLNSTAGLAAGDTMSVSSVDPRLNGSYVLATAGSGTITYADPATNQYSIASATITGGTQNAATVQVTTPGPPANPNYLSAGPPADQITVASSNDSRLNGTFNVTSGPGAAGGTSFSYALGHGLVATTNGGGTSKSAQGSMITLTATAAPPFASNDNVTVNTGFLAYDVTNVPVTVSGKTLQYSSVPFQSTGWTNGAQVTVTTGGAGTKNGLNANDTVNVRFDSTHNCAGVAVAAPNATSFKFTPTAGCVPAAGATPPTVRLVKTNAATAGAGNAFETSGSTTASCNNCVTGPGFIPANSPAPGSASAVLTAVRSTPATGTFSPAWMQASGLAVGAGGIPTSPSPRVMSSGSLSQGTYYGGICLGSGNGTDCVGNHCAASGTPSAANTVTLHPGTYIMAGGGFQVCGSVTLSAPNVLIYSTNDPSAPNATYGGVGQVEINTTGSVTLGPQTAAQDPFYAGFTIWEDRNQVVDPPSSFTGSNYGQKYKLAANISAASRVFDVMPTAAASCSALANPPNCIGAGNLISIGGEMMMVTQVAQDGANQKITVTRAFYQTTETAHSAGDAVQSVSQGGPKCNDKTNSTSNYDVAFIHAGTAAGATGPLSTISGTVYAAGPRADVENNLVGVANLAVLSSCIFINSGSVPAGAPTSEFDFQSSATNPLGAVTAALSG